MAQVNNLTVLGSAYVAGHIAAGEDIICPNGLSIPNGYLSYCGNTSNPTSVDPKFSKVSLGDSRDFASHLLFLTNSDFSCHCILPAEGETTTTKVVLVRDSGGSWVSPSITITKISRGYQLDVNSYYNSAIDHSFPTSTRWAII